MHVFIYSLNRVFFVLICIILALAEKNRATIIFLTNTWKGYAV